MLRRNRSKPQRDLLAQGDEVKLGLAERDLARLQRSEIEHLIGHLHEVKHLNLDFSAAARHTRNITLRRRAANRLREEANR